MLRKFGCLFACTFAFAWHRPYFFFIPASLSIGEQCHHACFQKISSNTAREICVGFAVAVAAAAAGWLLLDGPLGCARMGISAVQAAEEAAAALGWAFPFPLEWPAFESPVFLLLFRPMAGQM
jgi:hypothetical protein